jgi:hypothetical protein
MWITYDDPTSLARKAATSTRFAIGDKLEIKSDAR